MAPVAGMFRRASAGNLVFPVLLLLAAAGRVQAQHGALLQRGAQASLKLDQLPRGQESLDHDVPSSEAGVSGVFLPPFAHHGATELKKPHTVRMSHYWSYAHALVQAPATRWHVLQCAHVVHHARRWRRRQR